MRKIISILLVLVGISTTAQALKINEILAANTHTNLDPNYKQFSNWIELYNESSSSVNIGGYYLSDDSAAPQKWRIPSGTSISGNGYLLIWADNENSGLHTNFKLKTSGEDVVLSDSSANVIDSITYPEQKSDISCAKVDGNIVFMNPTPNRVNSQAYPELDRSKKPKFSLESGFYDGSQTLELTQENAGTIYYTTDGSIPTKNSTRYTSPIMINKTTVVRARGYEAGKFLSGIKNRTFLINEDITLPVVSIAINDEYLHDSSIGIYENYNEDWMRAGSAEYIKDGESKFSENVGIRIFGNYTRNYKQKSLAIFSKDKYGAKSIDYKLFQDKPNIKKVKSFVLRNSGNDWGFTMFNDALTHQIVKDNMDIDYQSYQPTVVFLNGKYWGIHNVREKLNEDYLEGNHGVDSNKVDLLAGKYHVQAGSNTEYLNLINYIENHDLSNNANYNYIKSKIDIVEYMNYIITELYVGNSDWLYTNIKYWREQKPDAKWRWILYDTDFGIALSDYNFDSFEKIFAANSNDYNNPPWSTFLFRSLVKNQSFSNEFVSRFSSHLNTTFNAARIKVIIDTLKNRLVPEIDRHFEKWPRRSSDNWLDTGYGSVGNMYDFANRRADQVRAYLSQYFGVNGNQQLSITLPNNGTTYVDGIKLVDTYDGKYFNGSKVTLSAKPDEGYKFVRWSNGQTEKEIEVTLNGDVSVYAIFEAKQPEEAPKIVITEINYKSADNFDTGDWVELYNNDTKDVDISGWILKDEKDDQPFTIPNGTVLKKGAYLVFSANKVDFQTLFPTVTNVIGDFTFGLGKKADSVRLFTADETLVDSVSYDENWPDAKGNGKTLTLIDVDSDNTLAESWKASEAHGTPGTDKTPQQIQTLNLKKDWNLVGTDTNLTLAQIQEKVGIDNLLIIQGPVKAYKKENVYSGLDFLNDFTGFEEGKGYWVKVANEVTIEYTPTATIGTISLKKGWNLINPSKELTLEEIKTQVGEENLITIQGASKTYKKEYVDAGLDNLNDFEKFEEPKGYWVNVDADSQLSF